MFEELKMVEIGGNQYPIKCDLRVLAALQDKYDSLKNFELKLLGMKPIINEDGTYKYKPDGSLEYELGEPNISVLAFALPLFIKSGIEQANEQDDDIPDMDWKISINEFDFNYIDVALALFNEFQRCFYRKKKMNTKKPQRAKRKE